MHDDDYIPIGVYPVYGPYQEGGRSVWKVVTKIAHKTSGKVVKRSERAYSAKEAENLHKTVEGLIQKGFSARATEKTVGDLIDLWLKQQESVKTLTTNRQHTIRIRRGFLEQLLRPANLPLCKMARRLPSAYEQWCELPCQRGKNRGEPKQASTLKSLYVIVTGAFELAVEKKWLDKNPMAAVKAPVLRNRQSPGSRLTITEALALWSYFRTLVQERRPSKQGRPDWRMGLGGALMLGAGLRVGEVAEAQVRGLDVWRDGQTVLRIFDGKTRNAVRVVPLYECPWLLLALQELALGCSPQDTLICGPRGLSTMYTSSFYGGVSASCRHAHVSVVGCHGLRRTFSDLKMLVSDTAATKLREMQTARSMGHGNFQMTRSYYLDPTMLTEQSMREGGSVFQFLDGARLGPEPVDSAEQKLRNLVQELGGPQKAQQLLDLVSSAFPGGGKPVG